MHTYSPSRVISFIPVLYYIGVYRWYLTICFYIKNNNLDQSLYKNNRVYAFNEIYVKRIMHKKQLKGSTTMFLARV